MKTHHDLQTYYNWIIRYYENADHIHEPIDAFFWAVRICLLDEKTRNLVLKRKEKVDAIKKISS